MRTEYLLLVPCLAACGIGLFAGRLPWLMRWAALSAGLLGPLLFFGASISALHIAVGLVVAGAILGLVWALNKLIASADRASRAPRGR